MGEQEKILIMINRWGYLNLEQIGLLLNKNIKTIQLASICGALSVIFTGKW